MNTQNIEALQSDDKATRNAEIVALIQAGENPADVAEAAGVNVVTIRRVVAKAEKAETPEIAEPEADEEIDGIEAQRQVNARRADLLAQIANVGDDRPRRNSLMREAREAGVLVSVLADVTGMSNMGVRNALKSDGQGRVAKPALGKFQKGYQEALADIAAQIALAADADGALANVAIWIENNRMAEAASIFDRAAREHGVEVMV